MALRMAHGIGILVDFSLATGILNDLGSPIWHLEVFNAFGCSQWHWAFRMLAFHTIL
jgi:hypothetical protein